MELAEKIMLRMGFPETETGPYVTKLRENIRRQVAGGMRNRSGGSWAPGAEKLTAEQRAKELLALDWEIEHGHSYRVECLDGPHSLKDVLPWLGDLWRNAAMKVRMLKHRVLGQTNPYL